MVTLERNVHYELTISILTKMITLLKTSHTKGKTRACWCRCDRPGGNPMVAKSLKITCDEKWSHKGKQKK